MAHKTPNMPENSQKQAEAEVVPSSSSVKFKFLKFSKSLVKV